MINDESTDSCLDICKNYIEDKRFNLIDIKHIGFPKAKNLGLDYARGDFICFIDSDDYVESEYLEVLLRTIQNTNTDISCCGYVSFSSNPIKHNIKPIIKIFKEERMKVLFNYPISTFMWNKLFKKEIFDNLRFDDVMALSDTLLCPRLFEKANSISSINQVLINHRVHNENMTYRVKHYEKDYWNHRLNVYTTICSYLKERFPQYTKVYESKLKEEIRDFQYYKGENE